MKVLGKKVANDFAAAHAEVRDALSALIAELEAQSWAGPHKLKERYPSASLLGDGKVIFNLKGTKFRLLALIDYVTQTTLIRQVGTHAEYDKWKL